MIYRLRLTYDKIIDILIVKHIAGSTIGYTLPPGVYESSDFNLILKSSLSGKVKVILTFDDLRLKSNFTTNKTIRFTSKSFFPTISCFTESRLGVLSDM